jgi:hypothetical protein
LLCFKILQILLVDSLTYLTFHQSFAVVTVSHTQFSLVATLRRLHKLLVCIVYFCHINYWLSSHPSILSTFLLSSINCIYIGLSTICRISRSNSLTHCLSTTARKSLIHLYPSKLLLLGNLLLQSLLLLMQILFSLMRWIRRSASDSTDCC